MCHTFLETSEYQLLESLLNFGGKSGDFGPIHRIQEKTPKIGGAENPEFQIAKLPLTQIQIVRLTSVLKQELFALFSHLV